MVMQACKTVIAVVVYELQIWKQSISLFFPMVWVKVWFVLQLRQLSRVNHPNIVKLYGACLNPVSYSFVSMSEGD